MCFFCFLHHLSVYGDALSRILWYSPYCCTFAAENRQGPPENLERAILDPPSPHSPHLRD